jgi:hypothetical protein
VIRSVFLVINIFSPNFLLTAGDEFTINITVSHNSTAPEDAHNITVFLLDFTPLRAFVLAPDTFNSIIGDDIAVHSKYLICWFTACRIINQYA